jgi:aldose 1-epimerase
MHNSYELFTVLTASFCAACLVGCAAPSSSKSIRPASQISSEPFGRTSDGTPVILFTLRNSHAAEVKIMNYGGIVQAFNAPDKHGKMGDVVLGYDNLDGYIKESPYFGALVGRYGNRIAKARFTLDGKEYTLAANNGPNSLHGGKKGFDKVVWEPKVLATPDGPALQLHYVSKDGEEGFPGNLSVTATYTFTDDNALQLDYEATTDKDTIVNLTQHSYFNLALKGDVLNHEVMIDADRFTPVDSTLIPTGELRPVEGTPFDFRKPRPIGEKIDAR